MGSDDTHAISYNIVLSQNNLQTVSLGHRSDSIMYNILPKRSIGLSQLKALDRLGLMALESPYISCSFYLN